MVKIVNVPLSAASYVNYVFAGKEPWQVSTITALTVLSGLWLWDVLFQPESLRERVKKKLFGIMKKIPWVSKQMDEKREEVYELIKKECISRYENLDYVTALPLESVAVDEILNNVRKHMALGKYDWRKGYVSGAVYYSDEKLLNLMTEVHKASLYTNPLHPDVFPGICKMEAEIIRIVARLFHGSKDSCGSLTSGGTESIIMACKTYRDYGLNVNGVKKPQMIIPRTAHAAFDKAGSYLGMQVTHIDVDEHTMRVNIKSMERAIGRNTVMLVGSAPNFPYGTVDDIQAIAKLGLKYKIPVHVDCCLGSFVMAFARRAGFEVNAFDFAVPGVTSISVDTHKYGFAPKGTSLVLYSEEKYRHYQYFASLSWPGGLYGSPSVAGSRNGAVVAECWATLMYFGETGYTNTVREMLKVAAFIKSELRKIPGIFVFGEPATTVVAFGSNEFHIYRLSQALNEKNWNLNMLQFPLGIHICVTQLHTVPGVAQRFVEDVRTEVEKIMQAPSDSLEGKAAMYGMSTTLPDRTLVGDFTKLYLDAHYHIPVDD